MSKHTISPENEKIINEFLIRINYSNAKDIYVGTQRHTKEKICTFFSMNLEALQSLLNENVSSPYYKEYLTYSVDKNNRKEVEALKNAVAMRTFIVTENGFYCASDIEGETTDFSQKWKKYIAVVEHNGEYDTRIL